MFEHVAGDCIDTVPGSGSVDHVDHSSLLLISFGPFAVEIVQRERNLRRQRKRLDHADTALMRSGSGSPAALSLRMQEASPHNSDPADTLEGHRSIKEAKASISAL